MRYFTRIFPYFMLIFLIGLFFFLRTHNLATRLPLNWDQENYSTQIKDLVQHHKLTLLGPRANNDKGFFLAPYFTYFMTPFYLISNLHPIGAAYFVVFYNAVFLIVSFLVMCRMFDASVAMVFGLLWATNGVMVGYDTIPWWPIVIPLGTLLTIYTLFKIYQRPRATMWYLVLGLIFGFFINHHFQFIFVGMFVTVFLGVRFFQTKTISWMQLFMAFAGFAIMFLPLLFFDVRHQFLNLKLFFSFFTASTPHVKDPNIWIVVFRNAFDPIFFGAFSQAPLVPYILFLAISFYLSLRRRGFLQLLYISITTLLVLIFVAFRLYGQRPSEYYFVFLYPFVFIILIDILQSLPYRWVVLGCYVLVSMLYGVPRALNIPSPDAYALYEKDRIIKRLVQEVDLSKSFNVSFDVPPNQDNGYRYLLSLYSVRQSGSPTDSLIEVRIPPHQGDIIEGRIGLRIDKSLRK